MANTTEHDANKHVPQDGCEQMHMRMKQQGAPEGERGCGGREEERMQMNTYTR